MELGGSPDKEASQWALKPASKDKVNSISVAQGFSKCSAWTRYISLS